MYIRKRVETDLSGKKFGEWEVIKPILSSKGKPTKYLCKCKCGVEKIHRTYELTSGRTKRCIDCYIKTQYKDLSGQKFGRWTVIKKVKIPENRTYKHGTFFLCKCECGNKNIIEANRLKRHESQSCGCILKDRGNITYHIEEGEAAKNALFSQYVNGARYRNLEFSLTKEYFLELTKKNCFYCGCSPKQLMKKEKEKGYFGDYIHNGVDRYDNSKGYTIENCVPCCKNCNMGKSYFTEEEFYRWIEKIYNHSIKDKRG